MEEELYGPVKHKPDSTSFADELILIGYKQGKKEILDKVCNWLNNNLTTEYLYAHEEDIYPISYVRALNSYTTADFIETFRKAMEE